MRPANSSVIVVNVGPNPLEDEQLELSACFKDDWCYFFSELGQVSLAWRKTSSQPTGSCEQYTHKYSTYRVAQHGLHFITRTRVAQELQSSGLHIFVSPKQLSSTCHVSSFAAPDTDHKHKFSLTHFIHFSYLSDGLTFAHRPCDSRPLYTLRCSTAEWRINTNPVSHRL